MRQWNTWKENFSSPSLFQLDVISKYFNSKIKRRLKSVISQNDICLLSHANELNS